MDEHPRFGYGKDVRPLGSPRDRDAEVIRRVLRRAGFKDATERHLDGFAVEGANASEDGAEPFTVTSCGVRDVLATVRRFELALVRAGLDVAADPQDNRVLLVQRRSVAGVLPVPRRDRALLGAAIACAVVATVALVVSWATDGQARLAGGIGSGVLAAVAAFLAALWYRRRLDEHESDTTRVSPR